MPPLHQGTVALAAKPEEAKAYGPHFALKREDSHQYMVRGVDSQVTGPVLFRSLQDSIQWAVKPIKPEKSKAWGARDWLVWAKDAPKTPFLRLTTNGGRAMQVEIAKVITKERSPAWKARPDGQAAEEATSQESGDTEKQYSGD